MKPIEVQVAVTYYKKDGSATDVSLTESSQGSPDDLTEEDPLTPSESFSEDFQRLERLKRRNAVVIGTSGSDLEKFFILYKSPTYKEMKEESPSLNNNWDAISAEASVSNSFVNPDTKRMKRGRDVGSNPANNEFDEGRGTTTGRKFSIFRTRPPSQQSNSMEHYQTKSWEIVQGNGEDCHYESGCGSGCSLS
ncbi:unnamed protein product [Allacma fusca]|uniref:Uncharacterized protein n=1 Tax=Allacma fusca TaxID=39272 RepID=A0A8J2PN83_9HEXA|nr:unnamed protein product [Allacma fusca]